MYLPKQVRLLLVGESPPASGKFFYCGGPMARYTAGAFEDAYGVRFPNSPDCKEFLAFFKEHGCYLEDLSVAPVNTMSRAERIARLKESVPRLSPRIRELNPEVVVAVLRRIEPFVREAIELAGGNPAFRVLPFPGQGHQKNYVTGLSEIVKLALLSAHERHDAIGAGR
jgi:hypothetical protein